jgi:hypothetical protein
MGKQKGGRIFYEAQVLKTPEAVEAMFRGASLSIPSQTSGQCAIDSITTTLFYADGIRQAMWSWFFSKAPKGRIEVSDEELNPEFLRTDARKLTAAFLLTIGARVLRILDTEEARESSTRSKSFSASDESHGTTPSEVCSNLGISLARVLKYSKMKVGPPGGVEIIDPRARTTVGDYEEGSHKEDRRRIVEWIIGTFLPSEVDKSLYGTFAAGKTLSLAQQREELVAINPHLVHVESEERPIPTATKVGHAISVVRVNKNWYIADNEVGDLLALRTPGGGGLTPDILAQIETPHEVYFEVRYTNNPATGGMDEYPSAQYFLRDLMGDVIASTSTMPTLSRIPAPFVRPFMANAILREIYGIESPEGSIILPGNRALLYWKPTNRSSPPPTKETSIMSMFGPAGASGGKRKTRKSKKKRRKTSRVGQVRPSLPK